MGFSCKVVSALVVAALAYWAYDVVYGEVNTNQMLIAGFRNRATNAKAMRDFAARFYGEDGQAMLDGKTILVTGTTSGLGEGIAAHIYEAAPASATLVLPVRSAKKHPVDAVEERLSVLGALQRSEFAADSKRPAGHPKVVVVQQDLSDLDSIDKSVQELKTAGIVVDVLINNAGLAPINWQLTKQGFDVAMGVNHFGTAHLTLQLNEQGLLSHGPLKSSTRGRVVMVSSEEHRLPKHRFDDSSQPAFGSAVEHGMGGAMERYADSKLALTTFAMELSERWKDKVTVYDMCPGPVASGIARGTPVIGPAIVWAMDKVFPSKFEAALPVLRLAFDPAFESIAEGGGGEAHHHMAEPARAAPFAMDTSHREFVFEQTIELLNKRSAVEP